MNKKVVMLIIDGWGLGEPSPFNAIANARTPNFDRLIREYPNVSLKSDGESVGLPEGQFGTSEVNHMTIGAGRVIFQDLPKINHAIQNGEFQYNKELLSSIRHAIRNNAKLNLISILSDGGVHTHIDHLFEVIKLAKSQDKNLKIALHLFTDGRDVPPLSAEKYFDELENFLIENDFTNVVIATVQGRVFLDRDRDWGKTEQAFNLIFKGEGAKVNDWRALLNLAYNFNISSDEQIGQYVLDENSLLQENDGLIFMHYRTDRIYQILKRIIQQEFQNLSITTMIRISEEFENVHVAFPREKIENTLAEAISTAGKTQLHITETEKFPHLTFFLNGERENELPGETWKLIESHRFIKPSYDLEPSMRNFDITKEVINAIEEDKYDFIVMNLSSPDMVGHTGNYSAAVVSAESVDFCVSKLYECIKDRLDKYSFVLTADHGNSEIMWDEEADQPHTQHTNSMVPFILITNKHELKLHRADGIENIAPTVLDLMGIKKPKEMTGESLIIKHV